MRKNLTALLLSLLALLGALPVGAAAAGDNPKLIAFTFDDGPSVYTPGLLDSLAERGAQATFFMAGANGSSGIVNQSAVLDRMWQEGHQLANHTYSHLTPFSAYSAATIQSEVSRVEQLIFQHTGGSFSDMVRTPGGDLSATIRQNVGAPIITWSVDPLDWKYRDAGTVCANILAGAHDGAIVLVHDLYPTSIQGALRAMDTLQSRGYQFVTVAELLRRRKVSPQNGAVYSSAASTGSDLPAYSAPSIASKPVATGVQVTFTSPDGLPLYYTTDGSYPTLASRRYTGPLTITADTAYTVVGIDAYGTRTPAAAQTVQGMAQAEAPRFTYENGVLALASSTPGARIYYTTDGSQPTAGSTLYTEAFAPGTTTRFLALAEGFLPSDTVTCTLTSGGRMFTDLPVEHWGYGWVGEAVAAGLMSGMEEYAFAPAAPMTRAMVATVLYALEGRPAPEQSQPFADVPENAWYLQAVDWARQAGVAQGYPDNTFCPGQAVTRQEFAQMLYNYARYKGCSLSAGDGLSAFPDQGQVASWAREALRWATGAGLVTGHDDGAIQPGGTATRVQAAVILVKFQKILENAPLDR